MKNQNKNAFTLVELLVVISIISMLASIVYASLGNAREKARIASGMQFNANIYHAVGDSAVLFWDFDEGTGTTIPNRTLLGNDGTLMGSASRSTNTYYNRGFSLSLNGASSYARKDDPSTTDDLSLNGATQFTLSAWIYPTSIPNETFIINKYQYSTGKGYTLGLLPGGRLISKINGGTFQLITPNNAIPLNKWSQVAVTYGNGAVKLYIDGQERMSSAYATPIGGSGNPFAVGSASDALGNYLFYGQIDDVRVFTRTTLASDLMKDYLAGISEHQTLSFNN